MTYLVSVSQVQEEKIERGSKKGGSGQKLGEERIRRVCVKEVEDGGGERGDHTQNYSCCLERYL